MSRYRADCSQCCGLCCVAPHQMVLQGFPLDKPAETPCRHLDSYHRCAIHATRDGRGYSACRGFDCYGAGQWVTQHLFGGAGWSTSPDQARRMFEAYRYWAARFEAAALIEAALPYVRDEAHRSMTERMVVLTTTGGVVSSHAVRLRRDTLSFIRAALRPNASRTEASTACHGYNDTEPSDGSMSNKDQ